MQTLKQTRFNVQRPDTQFAMNVFRNQQTRPQLREAGELGWMPIKARKRPIAWALSHTNCTLFVFITTNSTPLINHVKFMYQKSQPEGLVLMEAYDVTVVPIKYNTKAAGLTNRRC